MAIESDQLVFDFLSRVGDLAQSRQLPSGARMRLVSDLRNEIDRRRASDRADSPAAIRRLLADLGTPEALVRKAVAEAGGPGDAPPPSSTAPEQPSAPATPQHQQRPKADTPGHGTGEESPPPAASTAARLRRKIPRPRLSKSEQPEPPVAEPPVSPTVASPPHLAGEDELSPHSSEPDWWRVDSDPSSSPFGVSDQVPGFVGGVEIPEMLKRPPGGESKATEEEADKNQKTGATTENETGTGAEPGAPQDAQDAAEKETGRRRALFRRSPRVRAVTSGLTNPLLLLAAVLLVVGAVLGNWVALGLGWAIAYTSRRLTQNEAKFAVLGIPGLVAASGVVWLWGRVERRWGERVAADGDGMRAALMETWPWVVRVAAITSALYLVWRSQRGRAE
ncbi:hypothetical protein [Streptomyces sp. NPDC002851]